MNESGLSTAREREEFKALVRDFLTHNLATAPREQLQAIERAMFRWAPTADHRRADPPIFGPNGSSHLYADLAARVGRIERAMDDTAWAQK